MAQLSLEKRVAALEREIAALQAGRAANGAKSEDWRSTIGMFTGDEVMKRVFEEALKLRQAGRRPVRRRGGRNRNC